MTNYRRNIIPGATYFFTVNVADRQSRLVVDQIEALRAAFRATRSRHPYALDAIAVLPDHLHAIWTLPEGDADFAIRWHLIKGSFTRRLPPGEPVSTSRKSRRERGIWQRRYWEHTIRDNDDFARDLDYIHFNPVKHGHVAHVADWPYPSFHRFVRLGLYPADLAISEHDRSFAER